MVKFEKTDLRTYVLDTNVLLHDPSAPLHFKEHNVFIPMMVMEELDRHKVGNTDLAKDARQAHRVLLDLLKDFNPEGDETGVTIPGEGKTGRLEFQMFDVDCESDKPDNKIIETAKILSDKRKGVSTVILVTKGINMRIKATMWGLPSEDYRVDEVRETLDDDILSKGQYVFDGTWDDAFEAEHVSQTESGVIYHIKTPEPDMWDINTHVCSSDGEEFSGRVTAVKENNALVKVCDNYRNSLSAWGVHARSTEQNFALNVLMDPDIDVVTLTGGAGTGKTLLALASALEQVVEQKLYDNIIVTRAPVPVDKDEDIGFLPGTEEEKMNPWMGAIHDNIEVLVNRGGMERDDVDSNKEWLMRYVKFRSMSFVRGRSFQRKFIIIDEAQNMTSKKMKTLLTRAGEGTKVVCLGNLSQIDTPYITERSSGLAHLVEKLRNWQHSAHITLKSIERSRLAERAEKLL